MEAQWREDAVMNELLQQDFTMLLFDVVWMLFGTMKGHETIRVEDT